MTDTTQVTKDFLDQVNTLEKQLDERALEFHTTVDEIHEHTKKELDVIKTSHLAILHEQENNVSRGLANINRDIRHCEDQLRNAGMEILLKHECVQDSKKEILPKIPCVIPPIFRSGQIDIKSLTEMFGTVIVQNTTHTEDGDDSQPSAETMQDTKMFLAKQTTRKPQQETRQATAAEDMGHSQSSADTIQNTKMLPVKQTTKKSQQETRQATAVEDGGPSQPSDDTLQDSKTFPVAQVTRRHALKETNQTTTAEHKKTNSTNPSSQQEIFN